MYLQFFGLREKPFALSPDPRYLFLAESHREALAHLLYGVDQGEGFIAVVGEVGTGKTTLCRTLLQRLGSETEVAFIFNPDLSPHELLESVCNELGIVVPSAVSRRDLNDRINELLLHEKRRGRRVLLIIDEAQNLRPETLEQVRLLSNLETETEKLIQIVLLGQPELEAKLASRELRQLRQRISVWWHLGPMKRSETFEYVRHRLRVAGASGRPVISERALREVHKRSQGVPRVVNILCDRALLSAYAAGAREVRARHVRRAAGELGPRRVPRWRRVLLHPAWVAAAGALVLGFGAWQLLGGGVWPPGAAVAPAEAAPPAVAAPPPPEAAGPGAGEPEAAAAPPDSAAQPEPLDAVLTRLGARESEALAAGALWSSWTLDPPGAPVDSLQDLVRALEDRGLRVQRMEDADLAVLEALNHPALLRVAGSDGRPRSVLLRHLDGETATLLGVGDATVARVPAAQLEALWAGEAWVVWRDFVSLPAVIREGHGGASVYWLQSTLAELGFYGASPTGRYDPPTRRAVRAFQSSRGLASDGRVGPRTKMALYDALGDFAIPRLRRPEAG